MQYTEDQFRSLVTLFKLSIAPVEGGWRILFDGRSLGTKFDFENTGHQGLSFPVEFYRKAPVVFADKAELVAVFKRLVAYAADQARKKGHFGGVRNVTKEQLFVK